MSTPKQKYIPPTVRPTLGQFKTGRYTARSYVGGHRPWRTVDIYIKERCPAHTYRPCCAMLGGICYPTQDFQDYTAIARAEGE